MSISAGECVVPHLPCLMELKGSEARFLFLITALYPVEGGSCRCDGLQFQIKNGAIKSVAPLARASMHGLGFYDGTLVLANWNMEK